MSSLRVTAALAAGLFLASCGLGHRLSGSRQTSAEAVVGIIWHWEATQGRDTTIHVPQPQLYTLLLQPNGAVALRLDCNRGGGSYKISAGQLSFGPVTQTRVACPPGSLGGEMAGSLRKVVGFHTEGDLLFLELNAGLGTMRFRRAR
jgi:heat shock protein HslJ